MSDFTTLLQQGNSWLFIPSAILLGALHGLEPGHSKTMMAAFIIAIRGTVTQAVLLGLAATLSHTLVVWVIALAGIYYGQQLNTESHEAYFQLVSAVLIIGVAGWMMWRTSRHRTGEADGHDHHSDEVKHVDTGHGVVRLELFEDGVPPRFRLFRERGHGHNWTPDELQIETERPNGSTQIFNFVQRDGFLESEQEIPEPHEFVAHLRLGHGQHIHSYDVTFAEHSHHHPVNALDGFENPSQDYQDPHELAHATDIHRRFSDRTVTTGQIVLFGLTGGLIPCPASITVLLLCLQLKKFVLGATLVLSFSIGLALTMVLSGVLAALSLRHVSRRWHGFGAFAHRAPYFSGAIILLVGFYVGWQGLSTLL